MNHRTATFAKRQREQEQKERAREREQKRSERRARRNEAAREDGHDPDIAGIVPGPQPSSDNEG
jgi:hypothetical protein